MEGFVRKPATFIPGLQAADYTTLFRRIKSLDLSLEVTSENRWRVEGWPWRIDFSRFEAALISSSGSATSISFFGLFTGAVMLCPRPRVHCSYPHHVIVYLLFTYCSFIVHHVFNAHLSRIECAFIAHSSFIYCSSCIHHAFNAHSSFIQPHPVRGFTRFSAQISLFHRENLEIFTDYGNFPRRTYRVFFFDGPTCSRIPRSTRALRSLNAVVVEMPVSDW